jgi:carboxyl-terminal processing protease
MKWPVLPLLLAAAATVSGCRTADPSTPPPRDPPAASSKTNSAPAAATAQTNEDEEAYKEIRLLTTAILQVRKGYVDETKTSYKDLVHSALRGMLESLDPHSQFMEPQAYQQIKDDTAGEFSGIGIVLGTRDNVLTCISPIEDTPAFKAGVQAGDKIVEVDGLSTEGMAVNDAIKKLRGAKGSLVKLKILRAGSQDFRTIELTRDIIKVSSVKGARMLEPGLGYVRVTQFSESVTDDLEAALKKLSDQGLKALILDLRNNPGGLLTSAISVSELFLKKGEVIVSTRGRKGTPTPPPVKAVGQRHTRDFPMAILINGGSASASEIVAGALQDNKRAVLVGDVSFGKASVQSLLPLDDQSAIRLTTAHYYTPSGRLIHDVGIQPDIVAPMAPDLWHKVQIRRLNEESPGSVDAKLLEGTGQVRDAQLDRAIDLLKGILVFKEKR